MPDIQNKETITVEGKNYIVEDLSDKSKYLLSQLQDLSQQQNAARARLHQIDVALEGFDEMFKAAVKEVEELPEEPTIPPENLVQ